MSVQRPYTETNNRIEELTEHISSNYIEYCNDNAIIIDGKYTLEELKKIVSTIEGVPPQ
jgi:hypothetical protein